MACVWWMPLAGAIGYCGIQMMLWAVEQARAPGWPWHQEVPWNGPQQRDTVPYLCTVCHGLWGAVACIQE